VAAPIPVKSLCVLLFAKFFSCYETQQLKLGTGTAIWWVTEPHYGRKKFYKTAPERKNGKKLGSTLVDRNTLAYFTKGFTGE
jgi:hypothetical protein